MLYYSSKQYCWGGGMADTRALRALIRKGVRVRLPPSAPLFVSFGLQRLALPKSTSVVQALLNNTNSSHIEALFTALALPEDEASE